MHYSSASSVVGCSHGGPGTGNRSDSTFMRAMIKIFKHESSKDFQNVKKVLSIFCASLQPPSASLIAAALEEEMSKSAVVEMFLTILSDLFTLRNDTDVTGAAVGIRMGANLPGNIDWGFAVIYLSDKFAGLSKWLVSTMPERMGKEFWIDVAVGHNFLCALYLKYCGNKSVGK